ncbi:MAG: protein phosphatase 2C domain-containing protein, partial [Proteobacteria bacterium]|nr:protein phosphatase 2C domain-containing protein [Pseudomonadota bacterium]
MQFEFGRTSRLGNRTVNQDRLAVIENEAGTLLVLGDGLGGKPGGELAAQTLVDSIVEELAL